jgi:hypothetical protein
MQFNNIPTNFRTIIIGDFNVNMLIQTFESTTLQTFMEQYHVKLIFWNPLPYMTIILIICGLMHQDNHLVLDQLLKHIGLIIGLYILH